MEHRYNQSLHGWYRNISRVVKNGDSVFLRRPNGNSYEDILFKECDIQINAISAWLVENGFKKGDRLGFLMDNCPEYLLVDQGLMQIGGVNVSVYPTLAENDAAYILNDSQCKFLFVGSAFLMKKALKIIDQVPSLIKIISLIEDKSQNNRIINYKSLIEEGKAIYPARKEEIEKVFEQVKRDDICTLIYTSGTTGVPKGVMLSHGNIMSNAESGVSMIKFIDHRDSYLSFLPLSHVFERMATYGISLYCGCEISFAQSIDTIAKNILEIKPSVMATVPRLLERIEARVKKNALSGKKYKVAIFNWAVSVGNEARILREEAKSYPFILKLKLAIAEKLVFSKIKARLGGKMRILISGGAALPQHVGEFFANIGVRILEGYGSRLRVDTIEGKLVSEFDWKGDLRTCLPGKVPNSVQEKVVQRINYFRRNSGSPDYVFLDAEKTKKCQYAALGISANNKATHSLVPGMKCWSDLGQDAAKFANISFGPTTVIAVTVIMADKGIESVGNRRWLLYPPAMAMGHGSTNNATVLWTIDDAGFNDSNKYKKDFVAWPGPNYTPSIFNFDQWSFSMYADFTNAEVEVKKGNQILELKQYKPEAGYGMPTLVWSLIGFKPEKGKDTELTVTIKGVKVNGKIQTISYPVRFFDVDEVL